MSLFSAVEMAPRDPILGLNEQFAADSNPNKTNLGVGVYYDDNGKLPLLKCVQEAEKQLVESAKPRGDYSLGAFASGLRDLMGVIGIDRCTVVGQSLGGAIAVQLATEVEGVQGLMLEGTFTSVPDVFRTMAWGWLPIGPFITQRFDSLDRIGRLRAPLLVVHGSEDRLIHPELGRTLYERAPGPKRFVLVPGGSHHNTNAVAHGAYREAISDLFGLR